MSVAGVIPLVFALKAVEKSVTLLKKTKGKKPRI